MSLARVEQKIAKCAKKELRQAWVTAPTRSYVPAVWFRKINMSSNRIMPTRRSVLNGKRLSRRTIHLARCFAVWWLGAVGALSGSAAIAEQTEIPLWPADPPGETLDLGPERTSPNDGASQSVERITDVRRPTLTWYPAPDASATGAAVVVCPGGAYNILAYDKEGVEVAQWLNGLGVSAAVLKYRVPRRDPDLPHVVPLMDAQRALRIVRDRADQWQIDPARVGMLGFSAGGHLAAMAGMHGDVDAYEAVDAIDQQGGRPDFLVLVYAAYLGAKEDPTQLSELVEVDRQTPPTFMVVTHDDQMRGLHAALLLAELKRHGVPSELHVFEQGGHGYGLRPTEHSVGQWPALCEGWLRARGLLTAAP